MIAESFQCLAIRQPWAWAVCIGAKDIENRTWTTEYRGPLAIQASAAKQEINALAKKSKGTLNADDMPCGAIIGVADLVDIVPLSESLEGNLWATGPYCWRFANGRLLDEPIAYKGALHLYNLPEAISDNIHRQLSRPAKPRATTATAWLTAITPDPFETHAERCASYGSALNDLTSAVRAAGEMIRLQPKSALGYRLRGLGLRCNGNAAASIVDYLTAVRLEPNDAEDHYQLALAYKTLGEGAQSESHWNTARQLNPETPELE